MKQEDRHSSSIVRYFEVIDDFTDTLRHLDLYDSTRDKSREDCACCEG
jgi:hypothetical protein